MTTYMHCRPCYGTSMSIYPSSFLTMDSNYNLNSNYHNYIPSSYHYHHDQAAPLPAPILLPSTTSSPRRRRRLQDPITNYASNYYATLPRQMSREPTQQSSSTPLRSQIPPLPPSRRNTQQANNNKDLYCDLFNLLEHSSSPSPPPPQLTSRSRQRRNHNSTDRSSSRHHHYHPEDFENVHSKSKNTNDRRRFNQRTHYTKERKRHDDKLSSTEQYGQLAEKTKKTNDIYQRRSSNKGFFRRIVCNYFCVPSTLANNGYSS